MPKMKDKCLSIGKLWANQKSDRRTDGQTDDGQSDPNVALFFAVATKSCNCGCVKGIITSFIQSILGYVLWYDKGDKCLKCVYLYSNSSSY